MTVLGHLSSNIEVSMKVREGAGRALATRSMIARQSLQPDFIIVMHMLPMTLPFP